MALLGFAALVLVAAAWLRGAEYDEQYTLFLTAGTARPVWPDHVFLAGRVAAIQAEHGSLAGIARDLRATDVHPPLYFWAVSIWRTLAGPGLFAARLFSVGCALVSLAAVAAIARRCAIRPELAMLLTLGSYGFVYTSVVARGFAPAQALTLCGVALLIGPPTPRRRLLAGMLFGAACGCNYLAVFVCGAAGLLVADWLLLPGALPFLALDAWFFAAQHGARSGQFPPFALAAALPRLGQYEVANILGGLPLYVTGDARPLVGGAVGLLALVLVVAVLRSHPFAAGPQMGSPMGGPVGAPVGAPVKSAVRMLLTGAGAPAAGLLLLGAVFNNTPIELRYLSFGTPFIALLLARTFGSAGQDAIRAGWASGWRTVLLIVLLSVQTAAIAGLMLVAPTMQPARFTAAAAARLVGDGVVLLPRGNDGVGIVGAFGLEAPASLPILLVSPTDPGADPPALLRARVAGYRRVVLALLAQDRDSAASVKQMRAAFTAPGWRRAATGFNVEVFEQTDNAE